MGMTSVPDTQLSKYQKFTILELSYSVIFHVP